MIEQRRRVPPAPVSLWPPGHPRALEYAEQEESEIVIRMGSARDGGRHGRDGDAYSDASSGADSLFESEPEPVTLPESTHTLFFTQPVFSWPFFFAACIVVISIMCLIMALQNGVDVFDLDDENPLNIPANVDASVKIAQYLAILIVLLMEEEIPTGLHQLRSIPAGAFKRAFPGQSYLKFFLATGLRIVMGYIFLVNVGIILVQATAVLDIFYDVLALQFIQQLDDIAFTVAKMEVLGSDLQRACSARLFQTEFDRTKARLNRKASLFLKALYFLNLFGFIGGLSYVTSKQNRGDYQCKSIQVDFGDNVWEGAQVKVTPSASAPGGFEKRDLVFSTFNGDYMQVDGEQQEGRPIYRERRKFKEQGKGGIDEALPFDKEFVEPAEIKYSKDLKAWVFIHPKIHKTERDEPEWLLRSPETDEYDLLNVGGQWSIWVGKISYTTMTFTCNKCKSRTDCNLNGDCENGVCKCDGDNDEVEFMGTRCEVKLKNFCSTLGAEGYDWMFSKLYFSEDEMHLTNEPGSSLFQQYNRPVYTHIWGLDNKTDDDVDWLVYTGRRWIWISFNLRVLNVTWDQVVSQTENYHAFWSTLFYFGSPYLFLMSDPTTGDLPVGVDWYFVSEHDHQGGQFGPYGALTPIQKDGLRGRGFWRCTGSGEAAEMMIKNAMLENAMSDNATLSNATSGNNTSETSVPEMLNATSSNSTSGNNTSG